MFWSLLAFGSLLTDKDKRQTLKDKGSEMTQIIYLGSPHITSSPLPLLSDFFTIIKPYYKDNLVLDILALDLYDFLILIQRFKKSDYNSCV